MLTAIFGMFHVNKIYAQGRESSLSSNKAHRAAGTGESSERNTCSTPAHLSLKPFSHPGKDTSICMCDNCCSSSSKELSLERAVCWPPWCDPRDGPCALTPPKQLCWQWGFLWLQTLVLAELTFFSLHFFLSACFPSARWRWVNEFSVSSRRLMAAAVWLFC